MADKQKIKVAVLFGGKSAEHEVSVQSAKNVYNSLNKDTYDPILIGIDNSGKWYIIEPHIFLNPDYKRVENQNNKSSALCVIPGGGGYFQSDEMDFKVDVVFPVLHGTFGEDGTVQGLLMLADVAFVGPGVVGSCIGMDKDVTKRLLSERGLPVGKFLVFRQNEQIDYENIKQKLGLPLFVKPANLGSSIGISKAKNESELTAAVETAFKFDTKIIIEEYIKGREIECSVLGNDKPEASVPGEITPSHEFYDYDAKYIDDNGAKLQIPAILDEAKITEVKELAVEVFKALCLEGMSRVDFFLTDSGKIFINEVNTIPGFTNISMYPKLWEASGLSYSNLIDRLINLAIQRYETQNRLKTTI